MTCEDCYHYEACKEKFAGSRKICVENPEKHLELDPRAEIVCQQFKDKSLIIELPEYIEQLKNSPKKPTAHKVDVPKIKVGNGFLEKAQQFIVALVVTNL